MSKESIIKAIDIHIGSYKPPYNQYKLWRVGITHDPQGRKTEHQRNGRVDAWEYWKADSLIVAREVEKHFVSELPCKGHPGGDMSPAKVTYVYAFRF